MTWNDRITRAEHKGKFTPEDVEAAGHLSTGVVCEHQTFKAVAGHLRLTKKAYDLGCTFGEAVFDDDFVCARDIHTEIAKMKNVSVENDMGLLFAAAKTRGYFSDEDKHNLNVWYIESPAFKGTEFNTAYTSLLKYIDNMDIDSAAGVFEKLEKHRGMIL